MIERQLIGRSAGRAAVLASPVAMDGSLTRAPRRPRSKWRGLARELPVLARRPARISGLLARGLTLASGFAVCAFIVCAIAPELCATHPPTDMQGDAVLAAPGLEHWLGTDQFGRDVFSLVVFGARQSLLVGVSAMLVGSSIGVPIGLVAGYFGGRVDMLLMRMTTTVLAVSVAQVPRYARVLRGRTLAVKSQGFVLAARASGASHLAILRRHIFPHCLATALVLATLAIGTAILIASGLSFLGLGVNDDRPDWGYQLAQARAYLTVAWWAVTFPGLALTLLVVSVNLLGDALRHRFDPRAALTSARRS